VRITTDFCKAWEQGDPQTLANFLAEDCLVRLSAATPVIVGRQAALDRFTSALSTSTMRWEINVVETFAKGPIVVNERHDRGKSGAGVTLYLVAGLFVMKDAQIKEWTDFMLPGSAPF
jgi:limonene-1,2-epoxide hydrolase